MTMSKIKIYTDEDVDVAVAEGLKRRGVKAWSARDAGNLGLTDKEQPQYVFRNKAAIFTHDDDFPIVADDWARKGQEHAGIIYVQRQKLSVGECIRRLELIVDILDAEEMKNHIEFL